MEVESLEIHQKQRKTWKDIFYLYRLSIPYNHLFIKNDLFSILLYPKEECLRFRL